MEISLTQVLLSTALVFVTLSAWVIVSMNRRDPGARIRRHLVLPETRIRKVGRSYPSSMLPAVQRALDVMIARSTVPSQVLGLRKDESLWKFVFGGQVSDEMVTQSVSCKRIRMGPDHELTVPESRLILRHDARDALRVDSSKDSSFVGREFDLTWYGREAGEEDAFFKEFDATLRDSNPYRGHCLQLESSIFDRGSFQIRPVPRVTRPEIILPEGLLELFERNVCSLTSSRDEMLRRGVELKRGILIHGPMGSGKTMLAHYLMGHIAGVTAFYLCGKELQSLPAACAMARQVQPALIILDDVDLMGGDRAGAAMQPVLGDLIGAIDTFGPADQVVIVMTTNSVERLDPSLRFRPGRIDQEIELPLPAAPERRRLIGHFAAKWSCRIDEAEWFAARSEGMTPAMIREVVRKAIMLAASGAQGNGEVLSIGRDSLDVALADLKLSRESGTAPGLGFGGGTPAQVSGPQSSTIGK